MCEQPDLLDIYQYYCRIGMGLSSPSLRAASLGMSMDLGTQLNLPIVLRVADGGPVSEANIPTGSHIVYLHGDRVEPEEGVLQLASNKVCVTRAKEKEVV